jgi:predicted RNase H-like HicB family nuclease
VPGCYSRGETIEELLSNLKEAIAGTLEVMREEGTAPEGNVQIMELAV